MEQFLFLVKQKDAIDIQRKYIALCVKQNRLLIFTKINPYGDKMKCNICNDTGWYELPNHRLECMERIQCMDCLLQQQYKDTLKEDLTKLFSNASHQKLAQIVAELVINSVDKNEHDDLDRINTIIQTKNMISAIQLGVVYSQ